MSGHKGNGSYDGKLHQVFTLSRGGWIGPESITSKPEMAKHNSRTCLEGKEGGMKAYWRWGVYVCLVGGLLFSLVSCNDSGAQAQQASSCPGLPTAAELKAALMQVVPGGAPGIPSPSSGVGAPVWLTLVDSSGQVCAVVHSVLLTDPSEWCLRKRRRRQML